MLALPSPEGACVSGGFAGAMELSTEGGEISQDYTWEATGIAEYLWFAVQQRHGGPPSPASPADRCRLPLWVPTYRFPYPRGPTRSRRRLAAGPGGARPSAPSLAPVATKRHCGPADGSSRPRGGGRGAPAPRRAAGGLLRGWGCPRCHLGCLLQPPSPQKRRTPSARAAYPAVLAVWGSAGAVSSSPQAAGSLV